MKRERGEEDDEVQHETEQLSDDDFGPRMEDMGPAAPKSKKQKIKRVRFEKVYLQVSKLKFFTKLITVVVTALC